MISNDPTNPNKTLILKGEGYTIHPAQDGHIYAFKSNPTVLLFLLIPIMAPDP